MVIEWLCNTEIVSVWYWCSKLWTVHNWTIKIGISSEFKGNHKCPLHLQRLHIEILHADPRGQRGQQIMYLVCNELWQMYVKWVRLGTIFHYKGSKCDKRDYPLNSDVLKKWRLIVERDCHNDFFWLVQFLKDAARYYFYLQFRKRVRDIFSFVYQTV